MKLSNLLFTKEENENMKELIKTKLKAIIKVFSIGGIDYNKSKRIYKI